jgi:arginase
VDVDLVVVPYDSAQRGARMGAGPLRLLDAGLPARLERAGHRVTHAVIEPPGRWRAEIRTAFELAGAIAARVRESCAAGRFPLVLAGNCNAAVGVVAGLGAGAAVLWCDAHGDFNTPETTTGGFLDGMALATLTGRCWTELARRVPGFAPVPERDVWLVGARDLDPLERAALERSAIRRVAPELIDAALAIEAASALGAGRPLYLHLDLDVLDARDGRANGYAQPGGASAAALVAFCTGLRSHARPAALTLSAYDPAEDVDGRAREVAMAAIEAVVGPAA